MRTHLRTLFTATALVIGLSLSLSACSTFTAVVGEDASATTRTYAEYVFRGFRDGWIPILAGYRALPKCGSPAHAPCYEPDVYAKLYVATDAATACMEASTAPGVPLDELTSCMTKVNDAKTIFTQSGLAPKEVTQ